MKGHVALKFSNVNASMGYGGHSFLFSHFHILFKNILSGNNFKIRKKLQEYYREQLCTFYPDSQTFNILAHLFHVNLFIIVLFESFENWYHTLCLNISTYIS